MKKIFLALLLVLSVSSSYGQGGLSGGYNSFATYINNTLINGPANGGTKLYIGRLFDSLAWAIGNISVGVADSGLYSTKKWRQKGIDSIINTSIALINAGADSNIYSSKAWRQKLSDSLTALIALKQNQLNGTGFVKVSGITVSYDNSTYLTAAVTSINASGGTTGMSFTGGAVTGVGTLTLTGTLAIANGGTGQTTKAAAFDALSPMSALGDIIYGGASGTGTRLPAGTAGQILMTSSGGIPTWTTTTSSTVQSANTIYAGPTTGSPAVPTFRTMVSADLPNNAALAGNPTTTTQTAGDNSTKIATTAYVENFSKDSSWTTVPSASVTPVTPVTNPNYPVRYYITALANAININNTASSFANGQVVLYYIKGTSARVITYGSQYVAGSDIALPTTTTTTKTIVIEFQWNSNDSKFYLIGKSDGY